MVLNITNDASEVEEPDLRTAKGEFDRIIREVSMVRSATDFKSGVWTHSDKSELIELLKKDDWRLLRALIPHIDKGFDGSVTALIPLKNGDNLYITGPANQHVAIVKQEKIEDTRRVVAEMPDLREKIKTLSKEGIANRSHEIFDELNIILEENPRIIAELVNIAQRHITTADYNPDEFYYVDLGDGVWLELVLDHKYEFARAESMSRENAARKILSWKKMYPDFDPDYPIQELEPEKPEESIYSKAEQIQEESRGKTKETLKQKE